MLPEEGPEVQEASDLFNLHPDLRNGLWERMYSITPEPNDSVKVGGYPRWIQNVEYSTWFALPSSSSFIR